MKIKAPHAVRSLLACALAAACVPALAAGPFSRTVFFGDSLTDSGHFRPVLVKIDPNAALVGRFTTNPGFVWSEYLATHYGTSGWSNGNGQGGENYAAGGARVAVDAVTALGVAPSLVNQSKAYLAANAGKADARALYTVWGGANDLFAVASGAPAATTIGQSVAGQIGIVSTLKAAGAQYILVPNLPDLGLTPQFIAGGAALQGVATGLASTYNQALYSGLAAQGLQFIPLDTFTMLRELAANPGLYGFGNATQMACKSGQSVTCSQTDLVAQGASSSYVFADGVHPATRTHELLAQYAASVIDGPRQQQAVVRSAHASARSRIEQVATHRDAGGEDGTQWWGGLRADSQRYGSADVFDGVAPAGLFGVDWVRDGNALGLFAGYGRMNADFGNSAGDFTLSDTTLGGFAQWNRDGLWVNAQVSYSWLDADIQRRVNLGPAVRLHDGQADGTNLVAAVTAGWEMGEGVVRHGPVIGISWQDLSLDGHAEVGGGSTALTYADLESESRVGRLGWQVRIAQGDLQPYARVTWDKDFEDAPLQARAMLQSQAALGYYAVPGLSVDNEYATIVLGARMDKVGMGLNLGMAATAGASGAHDVSLFATVSGQF